MRYFTAVLVALPWGALSWMLAIALFAPASRGSGAGLGMLIVLATVAVAAPIGLFGAWRHHRAYRTRWLMPFLLVVLLWWPVLLVVDRL